MRLKKIDTIEQANAYLPKYIKAHNKNFSKPAHEETNRHRQSQENLEEILCWKIERTISKNLEINYEGRVLQIQEKPTRGMQKSKAKVIEKLNGEIIIEHRGKKLKYKELEIKWKQGKIRDKKRIMKKEAA